MRLPPAVRQFAQRGGHWPDWVDQLPGTIDRLLGEWELARDGEPVNGHASVVIPVRGRDGAAMLKLAHPGERDCRHEHLALRRWDGVGAVRLLRADPRRGALLLERLSRADLTSVPVDTACEVVVGLYRQLHRPVTAQFDRLSESSTRWAAELSALPNDAPVPRRLVEQAAATARSLAQDPHTDGILIHRDLHYENVLAGDRQPWLAIDPQPLSGDPHFELDPMLRNRWDEIAAASSPRDAIRHRLHLLVDLAGFDEGRARAWVVVREVVNVLWTLQDLDRVGRPWRALGPRDAAFITRCVTVAKAVQD